MAVMKYDGKVIVISGASSGIGKATALQLGKLGNTVFAGARKVDDIELLSTQKNIHGFQLDITNQQDISSIVQHIETSVGYIDVLINNAGVPGWGAVMDREISYFKEILDVNLFGHIQMVQAFYPLLKKSISFPIIINMSSQAGNYAFPFWSPYHMSKWALEAFSDCLRRELLQIGIRVVVIQPGAITSNAFKNQLSEFRKYKEEKNSEFTARAVSFLQAAFYRQPRKEKGPQEVIDAILHAIYHKNNKLYYQPGRRLIPDLLAAKLPQKMVDRLLKRI
jgi:NAD(P)-dependent dehydrogenase (short-subunit alcohol dehydrogenase family)